MAKSWSPILRLGLAVVALCLLAACHSASPPPEDPESKPLEPPGDAPMKLAIPPPGKLYTGAYVEFGDTEDDVTPERLDDFEKLSGRGMAIVAFSSFWGEQSFPTKQVGLVSRRGSIPLIFWSPWDKPYTEDAGPDRFGLPHILAGECDAYIDSWADQARAAKVPLLVSWGLEMNGTWFPWSGPRYDPPPPAPPVSAPLAPAAKPAPANGKTPIPPSGPTKKAQQNATAAAQKTAVPKTPFGPPNPHPGVEMYRQAWRYIVDRVRARGARNIAWVFQVNSLPLPDAPWNTMAAYYPGPDYVDWLSMSMYGKQFDFQRWISFTDAMKKPYQELAAVDPTKPVLLAEWGVGEYPHEGSKGQWIADGFAAMVTPEYARLRGAIYWHERWQNPELDSNDLRINSSPGALDAYRAGVKSPAWLDRAVLEPTSKATR